MKYKIYTDKDFSHFDSKSVSGAQLAIYPTDYKYDDGNFVWQFNATEIKQQETFLNTFINYERTFAVVEGEAVLSHDDSRVSKVKTFESTTFDASVPTKIFGKCKCYNLIVRKGSKSYLNQIALTNDAKAVSLQGDNDAKNFSQKTYGIFCADGYCVVGLGEETHMINAGEQFLVNALSDEKVDLSVMGDGNIIKTEIYYTYKDGELGPVHIPKMPATFDDFKTCLYLANSQFRGAKFFFKRKRTEWLDEALTSKIRPIESIGVPIIIFIIGAAFLALILRGTLSLPWIGLVILGWLLIDCLIVTPLLYFAILPKPVAKHIKKIDELTPYEKEVYEFERRYFTRRAAKIIKREEARTLKKKRPKDKW